LTLRTELEKLELTRKYKNKRFYLYCTARGDGSKITKQVQADSWGKKNRLRPNQQTANWIQTRCCLGQGTGNRGRFNQESRISQEQRVSPVGQAMEEASSSTRNLQTRNKDSNFSSGERQPGSVTGSNNKDQIK
jgi:hypothetical protein